MYLTFSKVCQIQRITNLFLPQYHSRLSEYTYAVAEITSMALQVSTASRVLYLGSVDLWRYINPRRSLRTSRQFASVPIKACLLKVGQEPLPFSHCGVVSWSVAYTGSKLRGLLCVVSRHLECWQEGPPQHFQGRLDIVLETC